MLEILRSELSKRLLAGFALIAISSSCFIALLACDVLAAGEAAEKEFKILELSQDAATVLKLARNAYIQGGEKAMKIEYTVEKHDRLFATVFDSFERLPAKFQQNGFDPEKLQPLRKALKRLQALLRKIIDEGHQGNPNNQERMQFVFRSLDCFKAFLRDVQYLHISIGDVELKTALDLDPRQLLLASALLNIMLITLVAIFVERKITSPIKRLINNCSYLERSQAMPEPEEARTEIAVLEKSLYQMSLALSQNEKGRRNYLETLKTVQSSSLLTVMNLVSKLKEGRVSSAKLEKTYASFNKNLNNLLELVSSMAEGLSNEAQEINPVLRSVKVKELVDDSAAAVEALLKARSIKLRIECPDREIQMDPALISRVLNNFLSNAIKYSNDNSEIALVVKEQNNGLEFEVKDSGPGISAAGIEKLFKKFSQLDAADGVKRAGTGLGLAICKQIVEAHKGQVGCRSEVGKGSQFWFFLPLAPEPIVTGENSPASTIKGTGNKRSPLAGSIKRKFLVMLALYLTVQFAIDLGLNAKFAEAERKSRQYGVQKEIMFKTHELMGMFLIWSRRMLLGMNRMDFPFVQKNLPMLDRQIDTAAWVFEHAHKTPALKEKMSNVHSNLSKFRKIIKTALKNRGLNLAALGFIYNKTYKMVVHTDQDLFDSLELEKSDVDSSYLWAQDMRESLLAILLASAAINLIMLAFTGASALNITRKFSILKTKSEEIAAGAQPLPSIKDRDELAFLDLRLCQVSMDLKRAEHERQGLMATINHDLRTPVNSILSGFELILEGIFGEIADEQRRVAITADRNLRAMLGQINDLLLIEKIDSGTYNFDKKELELCSILETCLELAEPLLAEKNVYLDKEFDESFRLQTVEADQELLGKAISAILQNAIQAANDGEHIRLKAECTKDKIQISIKNNKLIAPQLLPLIFDRFRSINEKPLVGIGLPLVQRICKMHGCDVSIQSIEGTGTKAKLQFRQPT